MYDLELDDKTAANNMKQYSLALHRKVRDRAIDLLTKGGWVQKVYAQSSSGCKALNIMAVRDFGDDDCYCLTGAIAKAMFEVGLNPHPHLDSIHNFHSYWRASPHVTKTHSIQEFIEFNDASGRTRDEVIASLKNMEL